jgi:hypothetical protein
VHGAVLGGSSSQHWPAFFQISKRGRELVLGGAALRMTCASGQSFAYMDRFRGIPIARDGRFRASWIAPPTKQPNGWVFGGARTIRGRLNRQHSRLTVAWDLHQTFVSPSGQADQCDSGTVRFLAIQ